MLLSNGFGECNEQASSRYLTSGDPLFKGENCGFSFQAP